MGKGKQGMATLQDFRQPSVFGAVVGSALLWAWFDALFMGSFFPAASADSPAPEACSLVVYAVSALASVLPFVMTRAIRKMLSSRAALVVVGLFGSAGTVLLIVYAYTAALPLFIIGSVCSGLFMGLAQIAWGGAYCHDGAVSATPIVAGSLALAVVFDIPLVLMAPLATAIFFAVFPVVSMVVLAALPQELRCYAPASSRGIEARRNPASYIRGYFGVSVTLFFAIVLVMTGFGYVQHISSFSSAATPVASSGVFIQLVRGGVAVIQFLLIVVLACNAGSVYRLGLLVMIGGFMVMPLMLGPDTLVVSAAVIVGGYTVFDLLKWCAFSQIAHGQSKDPLKTIALLRFISSLSYLLGTGLGMLLVSGDYRPDALLAGESNIIGYLVVIATVLLLSSEDIWSLFSTGKAFSRGTAQESAESTEREENLSSRLAGAFEAFGLTERENEVALLLARGRTQPWIAEFLGISESTVGTHVRHIYQKAGVHTRQEFLDSLSL